VSRRLLIVLSAVAVQVLLLPAFAFAYAPDTYPRFNRPRPSGNPSVQRIVNHLVTAIQNVPRYAPPGPNLDTNDDTVPDAYDLDGDGEPDDTHAPLDVPDTVEQLFPRPEIKIATYSHNLQRVNDALIAAHARGVSVQMVQNNNSISAQSRQLMRRLGTNRKARSFLHVCRGACRGAGTISNQHAKMYLFSRTGTATHVVMTGSANTTTYAATVHWNDLFTVRNAPRLYDVYRKVFLQMKADDGSPNGYLPYAADGYDGYFFPKYGFSRASDPVMHRLNAVSCRAPGGGVKGRTAIRVNMYAWYGTRGNWIAAKMAQLKRRGCDIRAIVSGQGRTVLRTLKSVGIPVRSASLNLNGRSNDGFEGSGLEVFTHEKWMVLNGSFRGALGRHVWTGSDNWSDISNNNDEVTIHVRSGTYHSRYMDNFNLIWRSWSRRL
jgi:phosphatidylserine/phosphatidylglycerophosphate/cardiolipin synthase-like enzyme